MVPKNVWAGIKAFSDGGGFNNPNVYRRIGRTFYVDTQLGANGNSGRKPGVGGAFSTMAKALATVTDYDEIVVSGVIREQVVAPLGVFDVTIIGAGNRPRQATSDGVPTSGGATWLAPTSPTAATPLLRLREQAWTLRNIFMSAPTDSACVELRTAEDATYPSAGHAVFEGMVFGGGLIGIQDIGGAGFVKILGCEFRNFTEATGWAIKNTSTAIANPLQWQIIQSWFRNNKNHIRMPGSMCQIAFNDFGIVGNTITTVEAVSLTGGANNSVFQNNLNRPANTSPNATLYIGGTNDLWSHNYGTDAVIYGVPDNS